jgi:hypothetical protein
MQFFSKFPRIVVTSNNRPVVITDFLRRVTISEKFRENSVVLDDYFILDGETPELVSYKLYGSPGYHWILIMINEITNPREEWPIPDARITDLVYQKYDYLITVPDGSEYSANDVVTSSNQGTFIVTQVVDDVVYLRSQSGKILLTVFDVLNNTTTEVEDLPIIAVTDPEEAPHHYYDTELGYIVTKYNNEGYSVATIPVSNYEYEVNKNDDKRTVKVLDPALLSTIVQEFESKIRSE